MSSSGALRHLIAESPEALEPWVGSWDDLAVASGQPFSAPGWVLPWWEHVRPSGADLRVVLLVDEQRVVGLAPFFVQLSRRGRRELRLLASGYSRGADLLSSRTDRESAACIARALAGMHPAAVTFEVVDAGSPWPESVRAQWPGRLRPSLLMTGRKPIPMLPLSGAYETWLRARSRKFRKQLTRSHRRLDDCGGRLTLATTDREREAAVAAFERLHAARWSHRGGSSLPLESTGAMLRASAHRLSAERLRFWTLLVDEEIVAVDVFVAAGGDVANWNGGWDESCARLQPGFLTLCAAIEDAFRRGDRQLSLGTGSTPHKLRFVDSRADATAATYVIAPLGLRYAQTRTELYRKSLRVTARSLLERLPSSHEQRVRRVIQRGRVAASRRP